MLQEYAFTDGHADPTSARTLLTVEQPQPNHNGGELTFGPDGLLYLGLGDGGAGGTRVQATPQGNGQSLDTLLGKILRIDPTPSDRAVHHPSGNPFASGGGRPEIWAYGLRNPWRFSFDRDTGDVWIADVGQGAWEEIDQVPFANAAGATTGGRISKGRTRIGVAPFRTRWRPSSRRATTRAIAPSPAATSTAGPASPTCEGRTSSRTTAGRTSVPSASRPGASSPNATSGSRAGLSRSFGEDAAGELYVLSQSDGLFRLDPPDRRTGLPLRH